MCGSTDKSFLGVGLKVVPKGTSQMLKISVSVNNLDTSGPTSFFPSLQESFLGPGPDQERSGRSTVGGDGLSRRVGSADVP